MLAETDVVIVGGGLAGLAAARRLHRAGVPWRLLEAGDRLGGRVATDQVDGYLLDRGFQVLNTAYPRLGTLLDLGHAEPRLVHLRGAGPPRRPAATGWSTRCASPPARPAPRTAGVGSLVDRLRFAALATGCATLPAGRLLTAPETTSRGGAAPGRPLRRDHRGAAPAVPVRRAHRPGAGDLQPRAGDGAALLRPRPDRPARRRHGRAAPGHRRPAARRPDRPGHPGRRGRARPGPHPGRRHRLPRRRGRGRPAGGGHAAARRWHGYACTATPPTTTRADTAPLDEPILLRRRRPAGTGRQHGGAQQRGADVRAGRAAPGGHLGGRPAGPARAGDPAPSWTGSTAGPPPTGPT